MTKLGTTLWIILTVILLIFPIRILVILLTKKWSKLISLIKQKIHNIKTLDKMRNELLQQRAKEVREENNINNDMMISSIFENKETEPDVEIEEQEQNDNTENINKNILEKQKIIRKISYEANVYKKMVN